MPPVGDGRDQIDPARFEGEHSETQEVKVQALRASAASASRFCFNRAGLPVGVISCARASTGFLGKSLHQKVPTVVPRWSKSDGRGTNYGAMHAASQT